MILPKLARRVPKACWTDFTCAYTDRCLEGRVFEDKSVCDVCDVQRTTLPSSSL